ncbi:MAG: hypothetical protein ACR2IJ_09550 [Fluviibacter sp.]
MSVITVDELRDALNLQGLYVPDTVLQDCVDTAESITLPMLEDGYTVTTAVVQAVTFVAMDVYQARGAANGNGISMDGTPMPYKLGPSLLRRVSSLLARQIDLGTVVG